MESNVNSIMKDCPHCGHKPVMAEEEFANGSVWRVACLNCASEYWSKDAALAAWNTRAGEDVMRAEIVRLMAENERLLRMLGKDAKM